MIGLLKPSSGEVRFRGIPIDQQLTFTRQKIGVVFQNPDDQFIGHTVREDVAVGPENLGLSEEEVMLRVEAAIRDLGIEAIADKRPFYLSGGEKRKGRPGFPGQVHKT